MEYFNRLFRHPGEPIAGKAETKVKLQDPVDDERLTGVLGFESQEDLIEAFGKQSLKDVYRAIYATRPERNVNGNEGILIRTAGEVTANSTDDVQQTVAEAAGSVDPEIFKFKGVYYDERRGAWVDSEWTEFSKYSDEYKELPTDETAINMLLEAGDVLFQIINLEMRLNVVQNRIKAAEGLGAVEVLKLTEEERIIREGIAILITIRDTSIKEILKLHRLDYAFAQRLVRIKYGIRSALQSKGLKGKAPNFEMIISKIALKAWESIKNSNEKPEIILGILEADSYMTLVDDFLEANLKELVAAKYGNPSSRAKETNINPDFRQTRSLNGFGSIRHRLFGQEFPNAPISKERKGDNGRMVETDYGQFYSALEKYDKEPTYEKLIILLRRAATFHWQLAVTDGLHTDSFDKSNLMTLIEKEIEIIQLKLVARGINPDLLQNVTKIIFGSRKIIEKQVTFEEKLIEEYLETAYEKQGGYRKVWSQEQQIRAETDAFEASLRSRLSSN